MAIKSPPGNLPRAPWGTFPSEVNAVLDELDEGDPVVVQVRIAKKYEEIATLPRARVLEMFASVEPQAGPDGAYVRIIATVDGEPKMVTWVCGPPNRTEAGLQAQTQWLIKHLSEVNIKLQEGTVKLLDECSGLIRRLGRASGEQMKESRRLAKAFSEHNAETKQMELEHLRFETYAELAKEWIPKLVAGRDSAAGAGPRLLAVLTAEERAAVLETPEGKSIQTASSAGELKTALSGLFNKVTTGELAVCKESIDAVWLVLGQLDAEQKALAQLETQRSANAALGAAPEVTA